MTHYIQYIVEPDELLLSWQPRKNDDNMRRFVGKLHRKGSGASFEYLQETKDFTAARKNGFQGFPGLPLDHTHDNVLPQFLRRLPPRSRSDFPQYIQSFGIEHGNDITDFGLLGYTGAKLPGDDFTFIHPFTRAEPPVDLWMPVAGYRYIQDAVPYSQLTKGTPITFAAEPDNLMDPQAIRLMLDGRLLGYVTRGLTTQTAHWLNQGYTLNANIERFNGTPERPLIYVYLNVAP
jgi:hypothetical protein